MNWARNSSFLTLLCCCSAITQAQAASLFDFFEENFRVEAAEGDTGPNVSTQLEYKFSNNFIAQNQVKLHSEGIEDHMSVGLGQEHGNISAKLTYNLHRLDSFDQVDESDDISLDLSYRALRLQHRYTATAQESLLHLPFDLFAATVDLSLSQTVDYETDDSIALYQVSSQSRRMKIAATWKRSRDITANEFTTEYQPYDSWLMKASYLDDGISSQRQFVSEYTTRQYRIAGEYQYHKDEYDKSSASGAISVEKFTNLAALKLRLEYNDDAVSPAVYFEVTSNSLF